MKVDNDILIPELARLLSEGKEVRFTPSGVSMRPFIEGDKDSVILAPLNRAPQRGDILLAQVQTLCGRTTYVLHRLIRVEGEQLTLMGDGNLAGREHCRLADVRARATHVVRKSGQRRSLDSLGSRLAAKIWFAVLPFRRWLLAIYRRIPI